MSNCNNKITLYTDQGIRHSLTKGQIDLRESDHSETESICSSYQTLWEKLGTSQIIWCVTDKDQLHLEQDKMRWTLEVPLDNIFRILDSIAWRKLIGSSCPFPTDFRIKLRNDSIRAFPDDPHLRPHYKLDREKEIWAAETKDVLWGRLFVDDLNCDTGVEILLRHPIPRHYVRRIESFEPT